MKQFTFILLSFATIGLFNSCSTDPIECIRVSSNVISETRDVKDYTGIVMDAVAEVKLTQGATYAFSIEGPDNVVELTKSTVVNNLLVISSDACFNGNYTLSIEITAPDFEKISITGIGTIQTMNTIEQDIVEVELVGIGDITANFLADSIYTTISGQGVLTYGGMADRHELYSVGEFAFKGYELTTNTTSIEMTGIGDCEVTANEKLKVVIEGVGNVYYKGDPLIDQVIIGTGEVIDKN